MYKNYSNYEVFENGQIWSYKTKRFLKPRTLSTGYQQVNLYSNECKRKTLYVHRIVYEAVTGSPIPEGMQVNHINEIKTDNRFENLNLMTPKENTNWGTCIERRAKIHSKAMKGIIPKANPPKQVGAFDKNGQLVMTFQSTAEAERNGFHSSAVSMCCRNCFNKQGNNVYKGFSWRYLN